MALSLAFGLHATHMLVPPTPGPLAVSGILGADLGLVILLGMLVSIPVTLVAYFMALHFGKKYDYMPSAIEEFAGDAKENVRLPSAFQAFLPILLPILLMLLNTVASLDAAPFGKENFLTGLFSAVGQPTSALLIGLICAFITYISMNPKDKQVWTFDGVFGDALKTAGQIVLIVGAGGAFASVLKTSNIQDMVTTYMSNISFGILVPFLIGDIFRTTSAPAPSA